MWTKSEISTSSEVSAGPAYRVQFNRSSLWRQQFHFFLFLLLSLLLFCEFFNKYFRLLIASRLVLLLPLVVRPAIVLPWPVSLALVLVVKLEHLCWAITVTNIKKCSLASGNCECGVLLFIVPVNSVNWSRVYKASVKNQNASKCFISQCSDICAILDLHCIHWGSHAICPEINRCSTGTVNGSDEKRQWIQKVGA